MPDLTKEDLWRQLKHSIIAPIYVLFGPETFLRNRAANEIIRRAFDAGDLRDFNFDEFTLTERQGIGDAIAAAQQLPMMSSKRVVRVDGARVAATSQRDTIREDDEEILTRYISDPPPSTVLIIVADELNGTRKISRLLKKSIPAVEFKKPDDAELSDWIRRTAGELDVAVEEPAVNRLVELVGPNIQKLNNELEKLSTAAFPDRTISAGLVEQLVIASREIENFALSDALVSGSPTRTFSAMKRILDGGSEPVSLVGLLAYNVRRLLMAKEIMARGDDRRRVSEILRMPFQQQETFLAAARRADRNELIRLFAKLKNADLAMKTSVGGGGPVGTRMQLEVLVCEILAVLKRN